MANLRSWMKIFVQEMGFPLDSAFTCESIGESHVSLLGPLMHSSYRDTIDYEGETPDQCLQEMKDTIQGKYGPFVPEASFVVKYKNQAVSAILITVWKGHPLVAYTMTDKNFQGKGLGKYLLGKSISSLANSKWAELFLVVTEGNETAEKLYERVGFKKAGRALPGTPPPANPQ